MAEEVVVIERVETEYDVVRESIAECHTTGEAGIEAAILAGEVTTLVEIDKEDIVVGHDVGGAADTLPHPIATVASQQEMPLELGTAEREVGHDGEGEIGIMMIGVDRRDVVEVALQAVVALHEAEVGMNGEPRIDGITSIDAEIIAAQTTVCFVDPVGMRTTNRGAVRSTTDAYGPLGYSHLLQQAEGKKN